MKRLVLLIAILMVFPAVSSSAAEPDYSAWGELLKAHYDPARGMNYAALKRDRAKLEKLRDQMAGVDVASLTKNEQLAYWINLYNISTVAVVADNYPVGSIRDISTDPIIRLNVFKKDYVKGPNGPMSLNDVENIRIREGFGDARIHFAINCAAASCPPIRTEPFVGSRLDEQLDDQARRFLNGPNGVHFRRNRGGLDVYTTKIMDWFGEDFEKAGGDIAFLRRYLSADKVKVINEASKVRVRYDDYDWSLNDVK